MTFREATQWLGRGHGIRRKSWKDKHYSIALPIITLFSLSSFVV